MFMACLWEHQRRKRMGQRKGKEEKQRNRYMFIEIYTPSDMWV